jgi:hypothetical protein
MPPSVLFLFATVRLRRIRKPKQFNGFIDQNAIGAIRTFQFWKLGCTRASGDSASTTIAASARVRNVNARRSTNTAISTTAVI